MRSRDVFVAETAAGNAPGAVLPQVVQALKTGRLGVSFSGAGFGASYQLGAAHMLQSLGLLNEHIPVGGEHLRVQPQQQKARQFAFATGSCPQIPPE